MIIIAELDLANIMDVRVYNNIRQTFGLIDI